MIKNKNEPKKITKHQILIISINKVYEVRIKIKALNIKTYFFVHLYQKKKFVLKYFLHHYFFYLSNFCENSRSHQRYSIYFNASSF